MRVNGSTPPWWGRRLLERFDAHLKRFDAHCDGERKELAELRHEVSDIQQVLAYLLGASSRPSPPRGVVAEDSGAVKLKVARMDLKKALWVSILTILGGALTLILSKLL